MSLKGARANPLSTYWHNQDVAREQRQRWYERSPGLLVFGASISVLLCGLLLYILMLLQSSGNLGPNAIEQRFLLAGGQLLLGGYAAVAFGWLLARFTEASRLCLGFLEPQPSGQLRRNMDDLLAVSQLSEQELLVGLLRQCLRLTLPPLLLVSALGALSLPMLRLLFFSGADNFVPVPGTTIPDLVLVPAGFVLMLLSGLGGLLCNFLLQVSISLSPRPSVLPLSGSLMQSLSQLALTAVTFWIVSGLGPRPIPEMGFISSSVGALAALGSLSVLLVILALYLGRRWNWLRFMLGHSIAGPLLCVLVPVQAYSVLSGDGTLIGGLIALAGISGLAAFQIFNPALALGLIFSLNHSMAPLLLPTILVQLLLIPLLAGFARDAIQRRKWEGR